MGIEHTDEPKQVVPTWSGAVLFASALVFGLAGLIRSDGAMLGLGMLLGCFGIFAYGFALAHLRCLRSELTLPRRVESAKEFCYRLQLENVSRFFDAWNLEVEVRSAGRVLSRKWLPWLPARGECAIDLDAEIFGRGRQDQWSLTIRSLAPFGLMRSSRRQVIPVDLLVRPGPVWHWQPTQPGHQGVLQGDRSSLDGWAVDGEIRGSRRWQAGDKPRSIVWPASVRSIAQGAGWMVRDVDPHGTGRAEFTIVFHSYGGGGALIRPWSFEEALGHVAGAVKFFLGRGQQVSLVADFNDWERWQCRGWKNLGEFYDRLALVERSSGTEAHEVIEAMQAIPHDHGLILLSDFPVEVWKSTLPQGGRRVWVRPGTKINRLKKEVSA